MDNSPWKDLKFYIKKEENKWALVMEHFKSILFHKYGPANKQHTYLSVNQESVYGCEVKPCSDDLSNQTFLAVLTVEMLQITRKSRSYDSRLWACIKMWKDMLDEDLVMSGVIGAEERNIYMPKVFVWE
jgi:hypothetical protein